MGNFSPKELLSIGRMLGGRVLLAQTVYAARQTIASARTSIQKGLRQADSSAADMALGNLAGFRVMDQAIDLECSRGVLRLEVLAADLVRLRLRRTAASEPASGKEFEPFSYALDPTTQWSPTPFTIEQDGAHVVVHTDQMACVIGRQPVRLAFLDAQGQPLSGADVGLGWRGEGVFCTRHLDEGEALYGLAEKAFDLNLRGRTLTMWNTDPHGYSPGDDPLNLNIPFVLSVNKGRTYGLFFDNPGRARFDLGQTCPHRLRYEVDSGTLCLYVFAGSGLATILERYTQLTGRMALPPHWMLGYHQSRWSYYPDQEVRDLASEFRTRQIPCDAIHLDIHYLDGKRVFTWDPEGFADPAALIADLERQGLRVISILDPGVKIDPGYHVHDSGLAHDAFCRLPNGRRFEGPVWPGPCYFPDFTDPDARAWWGSLYQPLLDAGVAGFWNDMNEPAVFGGEMASSVQHSYEGRGASHNEIHNVYGLQMARASEEGLHRLKPTERIPLISRAGYAGLQRHALVWTADNGSTWAQLRLSVSMCLNLGLCGLALCGPDVGGFSGDSNGELVTRWTQLGALMPFFRNHSALGTARQEPWAFGEPYESICRRWIEFRYQLLPYVYTAAWQATQTGLPMMRPLSLAYPHDVRTYSLDSQFLLGDALLVAPIGRAGQTSRRVYLPEGVWYDYWTGARWTGGEILADAPLERMPLYVRGGSVLPMGPVLQHTGEWPPDVLHLHVYPGEGTSWLYEDDGHSYDYQDGQYRRTRFTCQSTAGRLLVQRETEGPFAPGYDRYEIVIHSLQARPQQVLIDGANVDWRYDPQAATVALSTGEWTQAEIELGTP